MSTLTRESTAAARDLPLANLLMTDSVVAGFWRVEDGAERPWFERFHAGGLSAINITHARPYCGIAEAMASLSRFKKWFRVHGDLITQVYTADDIVRAQRESRVGIILGWQDSTGFDDCLHHVATLRELGLGVVQLTYNTANAVGSGCFESRDGGLTDFGHELVAEMNRVGMAIDLSHCGRETTRQTILASKRPVMYSHVAPNALRKFERNKTDEELRFLADHGGYIGVSLHPPFLRRGNDSTLDDFVDLVEYTVKIAGEDQVGIGTDFVAGPPIDEALWTKLIRDKHHARMLTDVVMTELRYPPGFEGMSGFGRIAQTMLDRRWPEQRVRKLMGENFVKFLRQAWKSETGAMPWTR